MPPKADASRADPAANLTTYRYGEAGRRPGVHLGVTRHLPRGVRKEDYTRKGYFDLWLPLLSPSAALVSAYKSGRLAFPAFARRYRAELRRQPAAQQVIRLLAAMARRQPVSVGCFCAEAASCHRSVLRELIAEAMAELPARPGKAGEYSSPACAMPEVED